MPHSTTYYYMYIQYDTYTRVHVLEFNLWLLFFALGEGGDTRDLVRRNLELRAIGQLVALLEEK